MKNLNHSAGRAGLFSAVMISLTGCVVYQEPPPANTVYVPPPPAVEPAPAPVVIVSPPAAGAVVVIRTENDFYEPLRPYGEWVAVGSYGRCWRPVRVEAAWRPYASGYWRHCDAGWYWESDEPWGWATYHYGRWDWTAQFGWFWVPQTQWAPAWVAWRQGAGYVGWAPLPPAARFSVGGTIEIGDAFIGPRFMFVEERRFMEPVHPRTVIVNNTTVVNQTVNITKIKVVNKTVINEGPRTDVIEHASGRRIEARPAYELRHNEESGFVARKAGGTPAGDVRGSTATPREVRASTAGPAEVRVPTATALQPKPAAPAAPRASRTVVTPALTTTEPPPTGVPARVRGSHRSAASEARTDQPQVSNPARAGTQPFAAPAVSRPGSTAAPKQAVVETPAAARPSATGKESSPAATRRSVRGTAAQQPMQPSAQIAAPGKSSGDTDDQPGVKRTRSPKDKSRAGSPAGTDNGTANGNQPMRRSTRN